MGDIPFSAFWARLAHVRGAGLFFVPLRVVLPSGDCLRA